MSNIPDLSHITLNEIMNEVHNRNHYLKTPQQIKAETLRPRKGAKPQCTKCGRRRTRNHAKNKTGYCYDCNSTFHHELIAIGFNKLINSDMKDVLIKRGFGKFPFVVAKIKKIDGKKMIELNGKKAGYSFFNFK